MNTESDFESKRGNRLHQKRSNRNIETFIRRFADSSLCQSGRLRVNPGRYSKAQGRLSSADTQPSSDFRIFRRLLAPVTAKALRVLRLVFLPL
jgi:hypothetical protein